MLPGDLRPAKTVYCLSVQKQSKETASRVRKVHVSVHSCHLNEKAAGSRLSPFSQPVLPELFHLRAQCSEPQKLSLSLSGRGTRITPGRLQFRPSLVLCLNYLYKMENSSSRQQEECLTLEYSPEGWLAY